MRTFLIFIILLLGLSISKAQTKKAPLTEKEKIEYLISSVEKLDKAKFYRNGSLYDAASAAKHLRMKVSKAGDRVKTAQYFIEKVASTSSMTGESYKIIYANGKEVTTKQYFNSILKTLK